MSQHTRVAIAGIADPICTAGFDLLLGDSLRIVSARDAVSPWIGCDVQTLRGEPFGVLLPPLQWSGIASDRYLSERIDMPIGSTPVSFPLLIQQPTSRLIEVRAAVESRSRERARISLLPNPTSPEGRGLLERFCPLSLRCDELYEGALLFDSYTFRVVVADDKATRLLGGGSSERVGGAPASWAVFDGVEGSSLLDDLAEAVTKRCHRFESAAGAASSDPRRIRWTICRLPAPRSHLFVASLELVPTPPPVTSDRQGVLGIAHDLKNMLMGVIGNAELLRGSGPTTQGNDLVDDILLGATRAAELCRRLMVDRPARGVFDLRAMIAEVVRLMPCSARSRVELSPGGAIQAKGDATEVRQIILNLLTNALEATESGRVVVGCGRADPGYCSGEHAYVSVSDEGPGTGDLGESAFLPFVSSKGPGRGIGLAQARQLAQANGGRIELQSRPGVGTDARLFVPAARSSARLDEASS